MAAAVVVVERKDAARAVAVEMVPETASTADVVAASLLFPLTCKTRQERDEARALRDGEPQHKRRDEKRRGESRMPHYTVAGERVAQVRSSAVDPSVADKMMDAWELKEPRGWEDNQARLKRWDGDEEDVDEEGESEEGVEERPWEEAPVTTARPLARRH